MVNFCKTIKSKTSFLWVFFFLLFFCSCNGIEDFHVDDDGKEDPIDTIKVLKKHTEGEGFPIIIMADGYTANDITNGTYRKAVEKAQKAIFAMEPMKSLEKYIDIIEVAVPSKESGITTKKKDTAFKTHYVSGNGTEIYGDSTIVEKWAKIALCYNYYINPKNENAIFAKLNNTLCIVLLNCSAYKGITLLAYDESVTDSIPGGFSLSYIPTDANLGNRDVFTDLVQHEAVGHGIGKLADEYYEPSTVSPAAERISEFHMQQKYGICMNISYNDTTTQDKPIYDLTYSFGIVGINSHPYNPSDIAYPLTRDPRYANEDMQWYQGGYTFLTYNENKPAGQTWYDCKREFYSPSFYSTMNATTDENNKSFNVLSRLMIYKRVKRAALGTSFKCNLFNAADLEAFATFDAPARATASAAKASPSMTKGKATVPTYLMNNDAPRHASPRILKNKTIKLSTQL